MSAGFLGFVIGAAVPVALAEIGATRRKLPPGRSWWRPKRRPEGDQPVDWDTTMPLPRTALRPRWEASSDPADEDDLVEFFSSPWPSSSCSSPG